MYANNTKTLDPIVAFWIVFLVAFIVWNILPVYKVLITTLAIMVTLVVVVKVFYWKKIKQTLTLFSLQKEMMSALEKGDMEKLVELYPKLMEALPDEYKKSLPFGDLNQSNMENLDINKMLKSMEGNPLFEALMKDMFKETKKKK